MRYPGGWASSAGVTAGGHGIGERARLTIATRDLTLAPPMARAILHVRGRGGGRDACVRLDIAACRVGAGGSHSL